MLGLHKFTHSINILCDEGRVFKALILSFSITMWLQFERRNKLQTNTSQHTIFPLHSIHFLSQRKCLILILHRLLHKPRAHPSSHTIHTYEKYLQKFSRKHSMHKNLGRNQGLCNRTVTKYFCNNIYLHLMHAVFKAVTTTVI